ncbi:peptidoglycan/LPS O-acetylase OafA/YrhL [Paraburkholderia sp. GAS199]|uniref:acyltransferase family protein n=1 Tax=Paraburkholderia sp. GAS199 TaxID=3035126 RepID=UPI003D20807F
MTTTRRYESIQVLRALAALAVVGFHAAGDVALYGWTSHFFSSISRYGDRGVDVFFVISGFVIAMVSYGEPPGFRSAGKFMTARIARVVPLYWVLTAVFVVSFAILPLVFSHWQIGNTRVSLWHVVTSFLFVPSLNWAGFIEPLLFVGWSLNYEAWFYLVFAAAMCVTRRPLVAVAAFLCFTSLLRLAHGSGVAFMFYTNPIVLEFVAGCCVGTYYARGKRISLSTALVILAGVIALLVLWAPTPGEGNRPFVSGLPALAIVLVALALETKIRWSSVLSTLGDASYSIYLTHVLTLPFVMKLLQVADRQHALPGDAIYVVAVAGSALVGLACHRLLERPLNRSAGRWLTSRADRWMAERTTVA